MPFMASIRWACESKTLTMSGVIGSGGFFNSGGVATAAKSAR
jgi:hypothetical protein